MNSQHWLKPKWEPKLILPEIPIDHLLEKDIKAIIIDVDKTLLSSNEKTPHPKIKSWIDRASNKFTLHIASNNPSKNRIELVAKILDLPYTYLAGKPRTGSIVKVIELIKQPNNKIAIIGDRIFTDILVGNRLGLYTILTKPLGNNGLENKNGLLQKIEKRIANFFGA